MHVSLYALFFKLLKPLDAMKNLDPRITKYQTSKSFDDHALFHPINSAFPTY